MIDEDQPIHSGPLKGHAGSIAHAAFRQSLAIGL
jgi:hypothetical protein